MSNNVINIGYAEKSPNKFGHNNSQKLTEESLIKLQHYLKENYFDELKMKKFKKLTKSRFKFQ